MRLVGRAATRADVAQFYPGIGASFRAWVCELDGKVEGIIGIVLLRPVACMISAFNEALRPYLKSLTILRLIKKAEAAVKASRAPVWALADPDEPTSPGMLARLGFKDLGKIEGERIFQWEPA